MNRLKNVAYYFQSKNAILQSKDFKTNLTA